jgi:hypothetical protein
MNELILFFKENYITIAVIVSVIFALLIIISIREWDLNPPKPDSKLVQTVIVETFSVEEQESKLNKDAVKEIQNLMLSPVDSFCQSHLGNSAELEKSCNQLTQDRCAETKCCILSEGKCVAGDAKNGPRFSGPAQRLTSFT